MLPRAATAVNFHSFYSLFYSFFVILFFIPQFNSHLNLFPLPSSYHSSAKCCTVLTHTSNGAFDCAKFDAQQLRQFVLSESLTAFVSMYLVVWQRACKKRSLPECTVAWR